MRVCVVVTAVYPWYNQCRYKCIIIYSANRNRPHARLISYMPCYSCIPVRNECDQILPAATADVIIVYSVRGVCIIYRGSGYRFHPDIYPPRDACKMKNMSSRNATSWPSDERYTSPPTHCNFCSGFTKLASGVIVFANFDLLCPYIYVSSVPAIYSVCLPVFIRILFIVLFFPIFLIWFFTRHVYIIIYVYIILL